MARPVKKPRRIVTLRVMFEVPHGVALPSVVPAVRRAIRDGVAWDIPGQPTRDGPYRVSVVREPGVDR